MKVHLIDGTYELFRSHFGQPARIAPDGMPVSAVRGLIQSLLSLLRSPDVTHIAVAFDSEVKSFRNEIFPKYKDGSKTPDDLYQQFTLAERAVGALAITCWPMKEFEADDVLATAAATYIEDKRVEQVLICSPDKDLSQVVVGNKIVCLDRRKNLVINEDEVKRKFGISPTSIPDYLGLMGDSADGIPGIPRWGAKASSRLLARYGYIENIPEDYRLWDVSVRGAASLSMSLEKHRNEASLYKDLATLRMGVPISQSVDELEWRGADHSLFPELCIELGINNLAKSPNKWLG